MDEFWVIVGAWFAAGLTLFLYSFLYKDNPFFKVAEHLFIGISVGYSIILIIYKYMIPELWNPLVEGEEVTGWERWSKVIPLVLGLLILTRFIKPWAWLSRWTFAAVVGYGAGVIIPNTIANFLLKQTGATVRPVVDAGATGVGFGWDNLWQIVIVIGVLATLVHFYYSVEHRGPVRVTARLGVLFLMISFGASFGYTTMARMALLVGRTSSLIEYSGARYYHATLVLLAVVIIGLALWEWGRRGREEPPPTLTPEDIV